jgi:3-isopropylmalate/(R)-2-methylmalate dehydratase small subunit
VVSTEIADIFTSNALKNGLVPVVVDAETHARLVEHPGEPVSVDLENNELRFANQVVTFTIEAFARQCLLEGVDPMGWLIARTPDIEAYEQKCAA